MCLSWFQDDGWGQKKLKEPWQGWETLTLLKKSNPNFNMGTRKATLSGHLSMFPYDICLKYIGYVYCNSIISVKFMSAFCVTPSTISLSKHVKSCMSVRCCPRIETQILSPGACFLVDARSEGGYQQVWLSR